MNIHPLQFEEDIESKWLERGKSLYEHHAVIKVYEFEKNLWIARVEDGSLELEVELLFKRNSLQNATCDCEIYREHGICPHITASLYALTSDADGDEWSITEEDSSSPDKPKQLTIKGLLSSITDKELNRFILAYSRSNPDFSLSMRIRFASRVDLDDNLEKYRQIVRQIKRKTLRSNSLSSRQAKRMFQWFDELAKGARDAFISSFYSESGWCSLGMIIELNPLWNKVVSNQERRLNGLLKELHINFKELFQSKKVPAVFKDELARESFLFLREGQYFPPHPTINLYGILFSYSKYQSDYILRILKRDIMQDDQAGNLQKLRLSSFMYLWYRRHQSLEQLPEFPFDRNQWFQSLRILENNEIEEIIPWYHYIFNMEGEPPKDIQIAKRMIRRDDLIDYPEIAEQTAEFLLIEQGSTYGLDLMSTWPEDLKDCIFHTLSNAEDQLSPSLRLYAQHELGRPNGVEELLSEDITLEQILDFRDLLLDLDQTELYELMERKIEQYLENHFGKPAVKTIEKVLRFIRYNEKGDVAERLINTFNQRYRERTSFHLEEDDI